MQTIDVPGVGAVDFPDGMSQQEMADAIDNDDRLSGASVADVLRSDRAFKPTEKQFSQYEKHLKSNDNDTPWTQLMLDAAGHLLSTAGSAVAGAVTAPHKIPGSLVEGAAQGTQALYQMALQSEDPDSWAFKLKDKLFNEGTLHERHQMFLKAREFNTEVEKNTSGEETLVMPKAAVDNRLVQGFATVLDPTVVLPGVGEALGVGRIAARATAQAAIGVGRGLRAVAAPVNSALRVAGEGVAKATGLTAHEMQIAAGAAGAGALANPIGQAVVGTVAAAKGADIVGDTLTRVGRVMRDQPTRIAPFESVALDATAPKGVQQFAKLTHRLGGDVVLDIAPGAVAGMAEGAAVGGALGYYNSGAEGAASGIGGGIAAGGVAAGGVRAVQHLTGHVNVERGRAGGKALVDSLPDSEVIGMDTVDVAGTPTQVARTTNSKTLAQRLVSYMGYEAKGGEGMVADFFTHAAEDGTQVVLIDKNTTLPSSFGISSPEGMKGVAITKRVDGKPVIIIHVDNATKDTAGHELFHTLLGEASKGEMKRIGSSKLFGIPGISEGLTSARDIYEWTQNHVAKMSKLGNADWQRAVDTVFNVDANTKEVTLRTDRTPAEMLEAQHMIADEMLSEYGGYDIFGRTLTGRAEYTGQLRRNKVNTVFESIAALARDTWMRTTEGQVARDGIFNTETKSLLDSKGKLNRSRELSKFMREVVSRDNTLSDDAVRTRILFEDTKNLDAINQQLGAGSLFELDNNGKVSRVITPNEDKARSVARHAAVKAELDKIAEHERGVRRSLDENGDEVFNFQNATDAELAAVLKFLNPIQQDNVRKILEGIASSDGQPIVDVTNFAALEKGRNGRNRYRGLAPSERKAILYGLELSKEGNFYTRVLDYDQVSRNMAKALRVPEYSKLWANPSDIIVDLKKYLEHLTKSDKPDSAAMFGVDGEKKRSFFYEVLGVQPAPTKGAFPERPYRAGFTHSTKDSPFRSFRIDRISRIELTGEKAFFNEAQTHHNAQRNYSPSDSDYAAAVKRGDMAEAQRMVDEAAKAAGYSPQLFFHGTQRKFTEFNAAANTRNDYGRYGKGFYFTKDKYTAAIYAGRDPFSGKREVDIPKGATIHSVYLDIKRPKTIEAKDIEMPKTAAEAEATTQKLMEEGYDGVIGVVAGKAQSPNTEYVVFSPNQIKSADPVTYDNSGNVIPLSERFNPSSSDIRYQPTDETGFLPDKSLTDPSRFKAEKLGDTEVHTHESGARVLVKGNVNRVYAADGALLGVTSNDAKAEKLLAKHLEKLHEVKPVEIKDGKVSEKLVEGKENGDIVGKARYQPAEDARMVKMAELHGTEMVLIAWDRLRSGFYTAGDGTVIPMQGGRDYPLLKGIDGFEDNMGRVALASHKGAVENILTAMRRERVEHFGVIAMQRETMLSNVSVALAIAHDLKGMVRDGKVSQATVDNYIKHVIRVFAIGDKYAKKHADLVSMVGGLDDWTKLLHAGHEAATFDMRRHIADSLDVIKPSKNADRKHHYRYTLKEQFQDYRNFSREIREAGGRGTDYYIQKLSDPSLLNLDAGSLVSVNKVTDMSRGYSAEELGVMPHLTYKTVLKGENVAHISDTPRMDKLVTEDKAKRDRFTGERRTYQTGKDKGKLMPEFGFKEGASGLVIDNGFLTVLPFADKVADGTARYMPHVAVVPERFTGSPTSERRGKYSEPPAFFKKFNVSNYERGGKFFNAETGDDITGKGFSTGSIDVSSGKPSLFVDVEATPGTEGSKFKTNLFKQKAGWKWTSANAPSTSTIVSVEGQGKHVYTLRANFETGVSMTRYSDKVSEPRLRPTAHGELKLGTEVGRISIRGKEHPVYDSVGVTKPEATARYSPSDENYLKAVNSGDMEAAQRMVDEAAKANGYNTKAHHGTSRGDRVGNRFIKSRATSGAMPYFTDNRPIAENYSIGKKDTSLEMPEDYRDWFKLKFGKREENLRSAWYSLTPEQRKLATERLPTTGYTDSYQGEGAIVHTSKSIMGEDSVAWELKQAKGNALEAAKAIWLDSGNLYNRESEFLDVLRALGIDNARLDDPNATHPKVYDTFLKLTNPLVTTAIPKSVVDALQKRAARQRAPKQYGADAWDKSTRAASEWMTQLREDMAAGKNSMVWTSVPDWVTDTLRQLGYDGIHDTGGKLGGKDHNVYIPFEPEQIKSSEPTTRDAKGKVIPLSQRFNDTKSDIRYSPSDNRNARYSYGGEKSFDFQKAKDEGRVFIGKYDKKPRFEIDDSGATADLKHLYNGVSKFSKWTHDNDNVSIAEINAARDHTQKFYADKHKALYDTASATVEAGGGVDKMDTTKLFALSDDIENQVAFDNGGVRPFRLDDRYDGYVPLETVFQNDELFKSYPDARFIAVGIRDLGANTLAHFDSSDRIAVNARVGIDSIDARSSILHEVQHWIQRKEGFAKGSSGEDGAYSEVAGEIEARDVQARSHLTQAERVQSLKSARSHDVIRSKSGDGWQVVSPRGVVVGLPKTKDAAIAQARALDVDEVHRERAFGRGLPASSGVSGYNRPHDSQRIPADVGIVRYQPFSDATTETLGDTTVTTDRNGMKMTQRGSRTVRLYAADGRLIGVYAGVSEAIRKASRIAGAKELRGD